jgi:hypothetical protein
MALKIERMEITTRGRIPARDMLCFKCGERKPGMFTVNANGQQVCPDCSGSQGAGVIRDIVCETPEAEDEQDEDD